MIEREFISVEEYERNRRAAAPPAPLEVFVAGQWQGKQPRPQRWIVDYMIPEGAVTMLSGHGASGKSILALQLSVACALGREWLGRTTRPCKVLVLACEDDKDELHRRVDAILRHHNAEPADLEDRLFIAPRVGLLNALVEYEHRFAEGEETALMGQLMNFAVNEGVELVVVDSLHDVFTGNENDRPQARQFVNSLRGVAMEIQGAVLLIAHPSRSGIETGSGESGSTAWHNAARSRMYLRNADPDRDGPVERILESRKSNYAGAFEPIDLTWKDGVFEADPPMTGTIKSIKERRANRIFLECLDAATTQGRALSEFKNAANWAPRMMARMKQADRVTEREFLGAMQRLFDAGTIEVGSPFVKPNRHPAKGIVRASGEGESSVR